MELHEPDIYEAQGYRQFLSEWSRWKKASSRTFSLRLFAAKAGFSSHTFLPKILDGSRNLSEESTEQVVGAMGLTPAQARFFRILVRHDQSENPQERDTLFRKLSALRRVRHRRHLGVAQANYYDHWFYPVLRQLAPCDSFGSDPERMGAYLDPPVGGTEVRKALCELVEMGLLVREGDRYQATESLVSVDSLPRSVKAKGRHDILQKGIESLHRFDPDERSTRCILLSLGREGMAEVREILDEAARRCLEVAARDEKPVKICQAVVQLFPLTRKLTS